MRLCLLFLLPFALMGQVTISDLAVDEISQNCVRFVFTTSGVSGSTTFAIDGGTTSSLGATLNDDTLSSDGTYYKIMCHAQGGETWYYRISVGATTTDCTATCTNCTTSDQSQFASNSGGISCTNTEPFRVTHSTSTSATPAAPAAPSDTNPYDDCDSDTSPTISSCANLATDLSTLAGTAGTHKVEVPAGVCTLTSDFTLPTLTTASRICIGPQYSDADLEPTDFTQVSMDHRPNMLVFRHTNPVDRHDLATNIISTDDNYTLTDIVIEDVPTVPNPVQATVTGYSGTTTVTLTLSSTCPTEFTNPTFPTLILNMPGLTAYDSSVTINSCSGTSLIVSSSTSFSGTLSGNGTATLGAVPISNAADNGSGAIRLTTAVAHGLPADANYTGSDTLYVHKVLGTTEANGRHLFTVVDATNVDLTGSTFSNAYSASSFDFLRLNSAPTAPMLEVSSTGVRMGRMIIGNAQPHYTGSVDVVSITNSTNTVLRDSIIFGAHINCPVSLTDSLPDCENYLNRNGGYVRMDGTTGAYIRNNLMIGSAGISIEANNAGSPERTIDFTFQNNQLIMTDRPGSDVDGDGYWTGNLDYYQDNRHLIELKTGCERCLITENFFNGAVCSENGRTCYAIAVYNTSSGGTGPWYGRDIEISHNYFKDISAAFGLGAQEGLINNNITWFDKILFEENFIEGNGARIAQSPRSTAATASTPTYGTQIAIRFGAQRVVVRNNTWYANSGSYGGCLINYQGDKCPECVFDNNIFTFHRSASLDEGLCRFSPSYSDYDESTNLTEFDKYAPGGSFANNLIIAGVEDPQDITGLKSSEADGDTLTSAEMTSLWPTSGSFGSIDLGPTDASYSARHTSVFGTDQEPDGDYSTYGVSDLAALRRGAFGEVRGLSVTHPGDLIFSFTAPTTTNCTVRLTDDAWSTASTATATEGTYSQTVTFASIGSGSYEAIVECQNAKPLIWTGSL